MENMEDTDKEKSELEAQVDELYDRILENLKESIKETKLSQDEIAFRCGRSQAWISRILGAKRGKALPFKTILLIAMAAKVDLTNFYLTTSQFHARLQALKSEIDKMIVNE